MHLFGLRARAQFAQRLKCQPYKRVGRSEGGFDDNFSFFFSVKPYDVIPLLNRLNMTPQMRGHNIHFYVKLTKVFRNYHQIFPLI